MSKYSKAEVEYRVNAPKVAQAVVSFPNPLTLSTAIRFCETDYTDRWSLMIMNKTQDRKIGSKVR